MPDGNRAILFGGQVIDNSGYHFTNDAYIVTYSKDSVVSCYHLLMYWPTIINDFDMTRDSDIIIISYYYDPSKSRGYTIKVVHMGNIKGVYTSLGTCSFACVGMVW